MNKNPSFDQPVRLHMNDPAAVAASAPQLLGFFPQDSLVLVTTTATEPPRMAVTARVDLPPPWLYKFAADALINPLLANDVACAALVLVGSSRLDPRTPDGGWTGPSKDGLPHREFVKVLSGALAQAGIEVVNAAWMHRIETGQRWWSYDDPDDNGRLPDVHGTELAAAAVLGGDVIMRDRTDLAVMLEPVSADTLHRIEAALARRLQDAPRADAASSVRLVTDALAYTGELTRSEGSERVAELLVALESADVRAACISMAVDDRASDAERLWVALTKATPGSWRAEPAFLLAVSAYARGNGALAREAAAVALTANPPAPLRAAGRPRPAPRAADAGVPVRAPRVDRDAARSEPVTLPARTAPGHEENNNDHR